MIVGDRLREIRESKGLSQGDIEQRTGLLRCYISRVENGHTVPAVETLEKFACALEVQMYQFFFDSKHGEPRELDLATPTSTRKLSKADAAVMARIRALLPQMEDRDKHFLVTFAQKLVSARQKSLE
jgi:transcriptional regulator with XRE-family HTH domain